MSIYAPTAAHLDLLAAELKAGGLVALPTETVYGLAAIATNPDACRKIFALKKRPFFDPLIVHVSGLQQARQYADLDQRAERLGQAFWPGALTMVLPKKDCIPPEVSSGLPTVALRAPGHALFQEILKRTESGLAAPSANPFGYISPTEASHVEDSFGAELPYILDGGPCQIGVESTIVDLSQDASIKILRMGGITREAIAAALEMDPDTIESGQTPGVGSPFPSEAHPAIAPGLLKRHYSPRKSLSLFPHGKMPEPKQAPTHAHLFHSQPGQLDGNVFALSVHGDGKEAAARLYASLRILDAGPWEGILAELPPQGSDFEDAIRDRLERAAAKAD